jgi:hypothetical protein
VIVTPFTWLIAVLGFALMALLLPLQLVAVIRPRGAWTIANVYGGDPGSTDPKAYFAFNQGYAYADVFFWGPVQIAGCVGMVLGARWGFLLALIGSVPFWYTAVNFHTWNRALGITRPTLFYWVVSWGMWPAFGVLEMLYCFVRLLG